jgi:hypothetical protein
MSILSRLSSVVLYVYAISDKGVASYVDTIVVWPILGQITNHPVVKRILDSGMNVECAESPAYSAFY